MDTELTKLTNSTELLNMLKEKTIRNLDLTQINFSELENIDFSEKELENIVFSNNKTLKEVKFSHSELINCKFENSTLIDCRFENSTLINCDFTKAKIKSKDKTKLASFKEAKISKTKFRNTEIDVCDFRYADIVDSTLQGTQFKYADFYRAAFKGITIFQDAKMESCSLNYISFETFCITRDNLKKYKSKYYPLQKYKYLVQEDKNIYEDFLEKWDRFDTGSKNMSEKIDESLRSKYKEAERIYRQLSALWEAKGYNKDAEWAYVQAKRMERKHLWFEKEQNRNTEQDYVQAKRIKCKHLWFKIKSTVNKFMRKPKAILNFLTYIFLGYGVSLPKVFFTYVILIVVFGLIYNSRLTEDFGTCMKLSTCYTIGGGNPFFPAIIEILSILQTGLGMLLTGFLGFVVANKIRKS